MVKKELPDIAAEIAKLYPEIIEQQSGKVAEYIPALASADPKIFATSLRGISGFCQDFGQSSKSFTVQSISKAINYCIAQEVCGENKTHAFIGHEPSGLSFNEITLDHKKRPHNPLINAGGLMSTALILSEAKEHALPMILEFWSRLTGGEKVNLDGQIYESERRTGHRNYALAHFLKEQAHMPCQADPHEIAELYFLSCSIIQTTQSLSQIAATLANGGVQVSTGQSVFTSKSVRNCLSLMLSCGMYDFSGEFAFEVGMPAKSGINGGLMVVVPDHFGLAIYSPKVDIYGNSVRGVQLCKALVKHKDLHILDNFKSRKTALG